MLLPVNHKQIEVLYFAAKADVEGQNDIATVFAQLLKVKQDMPMDI